MLMSPCLSQPCTYSMWSFLLAVGLAVQRLQHGELHGNMHTTFLLNIMGLTARCPEVISSVIVLEQAKTSEPSLLSAPAVAQTALTSTHRPRRSAFGSIMEVVSFNVFSLILKWLCLY